MPITAAMPDGCCASRRHSKRAFRTLGAEQDALSWGMATGQDFPPQPRAYERGGSSWWTCRHGCSAMTSPAHHAIKVAFLDVGQGDTIVISSAATEEAIVVDCVDGQVVTDYLMSLGIKRLRGVIITHLHADHYRGVPQLLDNCLRFLGSECEVLLYNKFTAHNRKKVEELSNDKDGHSVACLGNSDPTVVSRTRVATFRNLAEWTASHKNYYAPASLGAHKLPRAWAVASNRSPSSVSCGS